MTRVTVQPGFRKRLDSLRRRYDPRNIGERVEVLFVGESPPGQKGPMLRYFYNPEFHSRGLRSYIERNLVGAGFDVAPQSASVFLESFQHLGFYLTDTIKDPLIKGEGSETLGSLAEKYVEELAKEIETLEPSFIFTLGALATKTATGYNEVKKHHGTLVATHQLHESRLGRAVSCAEAVIISVYPSPRTHPDIGLPFRRLRKQLGQG